MRPLKNLSRKALITISLLVWFVPSLFLLFQLAKNGTKIGERMLVLPIMYGLTLAMWLHALLQQDWFQRTLALAISTGLPLAFVILTVRSSNRRPVVLAVGLLISCALTAAAYCLLKA